MRGRTGDALWKDGTPKTPSKIPTTAAAAETRAAISPSLRE
ncbi:hypothetical protein ACWEV4_32800 [Streptomyces sp. NPDC003860]